MNKVVKLLGLFLVIGYGAEVVGSESPNSRDLSPDERAAFGIGLAPIAAPVVPAASPSVEAEKSAKLSQGESKRGDADRQSGLLGGSAAPLAASVDIRDDEFKLRDEADRQASLERLFASGALKKCLTKNCRNPGLPFETFEKNSTGGGWYQKSENYCKSCLPKQENIRTEFRKLIQKCTACPKYELFLYCKTYQNKQYCNECYWKLPWLSPSNPLSKIANWVGSRKRLGLIALGAWLLYNNRNEIRSGCNTLWCRLGLGRAAIPA